MKTFLAPKYVPALSWGVLVLLMLGALLIYRDAGKPLPYPKNAAAPEQPGVETQSIQLALNELKGIRRLESGWASPLPAADPILALPPLSVNPKSKSAQSEEEAGQSSLIVLETARGKVAVINGQTARTGQKLANGDLVQKIGNTFVVLQPLRGDVRRIDMEGRYAPAQPDPKKESAK
jgi:hypothetical protein